MFGIGWTEAIFIVLILLVFVGPKHLPGMMRKLGRIVSELQSASRELRTQIDLETRDIEDPRDIARDLKDTALDAIRSPYEEAREMDEKLRRELREAASEDALARAEGEADPAKLGAVEPPPDDDDRGAR